MRLFLKLGLLTVCAALLGGAASVRADTLTLGVSSPGARFSPGTWAGRDGRGGTESRRTWNNGAWCEWRWTTDAPQPTAVLQITNPTPGSAVSLFLDGALTDNLPVPSSGGIPVPGLSGPGPHTLRVYTRNSPQEKRWSGENAYTVTGLAVDSRASPLPASPRRTWVLVVGDSITEGIQADNGRDSSLRDYAFLLAQGLDAAGVDVGVSACGYSGWLRPGDAGGDVPAYFPPGGTGGRWSRIDSRTSLLDTHGHLSADGGVGQEPEMVLLNYGVNECLSGSDLGQMQASVSGAMAALRQAAPRARILLLVPPGLADTRIYPQGPRYIEALRAGAAEYQKRYPAETSVQTLDLGVPVARALGSPAYGGGVHPGAAGHAFLAPRLLQAVLSALSHRQP